VSPRRLIAPLAAALAFAGAGSAEAATSSNWAGYAVSRPGTTFKRVSGTWIQPAVDCSNGGGYSAYWVGIGGYHSNSSALEQIGTEADCTSGGTATYEAWYELVPSPATTLKLTVRPGDRMSASVAVTGRSVRMRLADETTGAVVVRTRRVSTVDTRSAEWIVEAPSLCDDNGSCRAQTLANFGTAQFIRVKATSAGGHSGTIVDAAWSATPISLTNGGDGDARFGRQTSTATAEPAGLTSGGSAFSVGFGGG
jgi:hypothetical protein